MTGERLHLLRAKQQQYLTKNSGEWQGGYPAGEDSSNRASLGSAADDADAE